MGFWGDIGGISAEMVAHLEGVVIWVYFRDTDRGGVWLVLLLHLNSQPSPLDLLCLLCV